MKTPRKPLFAFNRERALYDHPINAVCAHCLRLMGSHVFSVCWKSQLSRAALVFCAMAGSTAVLFSSATLARAAVPPVTAEQAVLSRFNGHTTCISFSPRNRPRDILSLTP
jgi:hypothetical protein